MKDIEQEYTEFLENSKRCNFQQSVEWGQVKKAWKKEILVVRDEEGKIVAGLIAWIRSVKFFGTLIYISRGPIFEKENNEYIKHLNQLFDSLKKLAQKEKAIAVLLEPDVLSSETEFGEIVKAKGFKILGSKSFKEQINPRYVFRLNIKNKTEEEILASFHQKTRYNIRYAEKKGVEIFEGKIEDIKRFHEIMEETGERDGFGIRDAKYFETIYDELSGKVKLFMARHEDDVIAGILNIYYGNKVWYLYGASSNTKRNLMPNYLLQWTGIKDAIKQGKEGYDFRGVPGVLENEKDHPQYGLYRFKKGFGAEFTEFIGQVYIPISPFRYSIFMKAQKLARLLSFYKKKILLNVKKIMGKK